MMCNCEVQTDEKHPCPYRCEIKEDFEPYCNCCDKCKLRCVEEI